ncbi:MAG: hypothetical protein QXX12_06390 [Nanopusillaceae archaeon]
MEVIIPETAEETVAKLLNEGYILVPIGEGSKPMLYENEEEY